MGLETVIGLGVVAFLFLYFAFHLSKDESGNETHFLLKLILLFFFIMTLILIPKAALDSNDICTTEIKNITTSAPTETYNYQTVCIENSSQTPSSFVKLVVWFVRVFVTYIFFWLLWHLFKVGEKFGEWVKKWFKN